jgi:transcriptional regulator with GAF, ATPase, and Fis domain
MLNYTWPGNVREMEHLIERQSLLNKNVIISEISVPKLTKTTIDDKGAPQKVKTIDENERDHIFAVLKLCNGRISGENGAAKLLGVPATTLNSKIKRLGLNKKHF